MTIPKQLADPFAAKADATPVPVPTFDAADILSGEGDYVEYNGIRAFFKVVTPEVAEQWLATYNTHNRDLQEYRSTIHARDMEAGNWLITGDTIRFANDPTLLYGPTGIVMIDGQHRADGIRLSGIAQPCLVVTGLSLDAQEVVDTGASRSLADMLKLRGWINSTKAAAVIRTVLSFKRGQISTGGRNDLSKMEMLAFADANRPAIEEAARYCARLLNTKFPGPSGPVSAAYYLCAEVDQLGAKIFFIDQIAEGINLQHSDPAKALMRRIINSGPNNPLSRVEVLWLTLKAWQHWRNEELVERLQAPRGGWPSPSDWSIR